MDVVTPQMDVLHYVVFNIEAFLISSRVQDGLHSEAGAGFGRADEIDDRFEIHERLPTPVEADEREEPVLDLIPLTRPRWIVAHANRLADFVGQDLEAQLPDPQCGPIAATTIRADQESACVAIEASPVEAPPAADTFNGKLGGVMADAHVDDRTVPRDVVGAVGHRFPVTQVRKVVHVHIDGIAPRPPRPPRIAKFPHQFLLFGIDRDDRVAGLDVRLHQAVDVAKLRIPRAMLRTFFGLPIRLQRIAQIVQTPADCHGVHVVTTPRQLLRDRPRRLARPAQQAHGVTGGGLFHDRFDQSHHRRTGFFDRLAPRTFATHAALCRRLQGATITQFLDSFGDRHPRHSGDLRQATDTTHDRDRAPYPPRTSAPAPHSVSSAPLPNGVLPQSAALPPTASVRFMRILYKLFLGSALMDICCATLSTRSTPFI